MPIVLRRISVRNGWLFLFHQKGYPAMLYTEPLSFRELDRLMRSVPNFAPRSHGIILIRKQEHTAKDCDCRYCSHYSGRRKTSAPSTDATALQSGSLPEPPPIGKPLQKPCQPFAMRRLYGESINYSKKARKHL